MDKAHVKMTVGGTTYPFVIDPLTYSEVDIVDLSPRAVPGTPAFSELKLYLQVAQLGFAHGFGKEIFEEPKSYSYTGSGVDTRHDFISLFTAPSQVWSLSGSYLGSMITHRNKVVFGGNDGLYLRKGDQSLYRYTAIGAVADLVSNGQYFLVARSGRMQIADVGDVSVGGATSITAAGSPDWTTDIFAGGICFIYEGLGAGQGRTVSSNSSNIINVSSAWGTVPNSTSKFLVFANAGVDGNPPNNFSHLGMWGGYIWASEAIDPWVHFWSETDASNAEGGQSTDTAAIRVGPGRVPINKLFPVQQNQLGCFRQDGVWSIGDDNVAYHMLDFSDQISADNFRAVTQWDGFLFFNTRNLIYKYRSGLQNASPPRWDDHLPYKEFGKYRSLIPRGGYLYTLGKSNQANTTDESQETSGFVALMARGSVGWHKLWDLPISNPSQYDLWLAPADDILYVHAYAGGTGYLWSIQLNTYDDLPYPNYPTTGNHRCYTSYYDLGHRRIVKSLASVALDGDFPSGTSVVVAYRVDDTTSWTSLGTITSPLAELAFPIGALGKKVQLRLDLQTTSSGSTPAIKAVILKLMMRPDVLYGVSFEVIVSNDITTPGRHNLPMSGPQIRAALKAARDSKSPITFTDWYNTEASAYVSSLRFIGVAISDTEVQERARVTVVYV